MEQLRHVSVLVYRKVMTKVELVEEKRLVFNSDSSYLEVTVDPVRRLLVVGSTMDVYLLKIEEGEKENEHLVERAHF